MGSRHRYGMIEDNGIMERVRPYVHRRRTRERQERRHQRKQRREQIEDAINVLLTGRAVVRPAEPVELGVVLMSVCPDVDWCEFGNCYKDDSARYGIHVYSGVALEQKDVRQILHALRTLRTTRNAKYITEFADMLRRWESRDGAR